MRFSLAYDEDGSFLVASSDDREGPKPAQPLERGDLFDPDGLRFPEPKEGIEDPQDDVAGTDAEMLVTPPPGLPRWPFITLAALALIAVVALRLWLPSTSSGTETGQITPPAGAVLPPWAPAEPPPALGRGSASWTAATIDPPTAYVQFCRNCPSLCGPITPLRPNPG